MNFSLDDLMPSQRRLLAKLCGTDAPATAIGCEISELSDAEVITAQTMFPLGLIEVVDGWRGTHWLMLTVVAQRMMIEGLTE
ncbi:hypothetical protein F6X38_08255 [Aureimonas leprariae]|uniref:Uncharacterized protein n=2 Tax=Plantimonas leprariae TaxID=2615207 RepID=A0A7V7PQ77_9HYPH|nr:hypothetical protein F6X38_08255 [Aureimonas leprariae]